MFNAVHLIIKPSLVDQALAIAREAGATGATLINARGAGRHASQSILSIPIDERMVFVLIIVPEDICDQVIHRLHEELCFDRPGHGVLTVSPLFSVRGLTPRRPAEDSTEHNQV